MRCGGGDKQTVPKGREDERPSRRETGGGETMATRDELTRDGEGARRGSLAVYIININYNLFIYILNIILGTLCYCLPFVCFIVIVVDFFLVSMLAPYFN